MYSCNNFWTIPCRTTTDDQGRYSIVSPSIEPTALGIFKSNYQSAWKKRVSAQDPTASVILHRSVPVSAFGSTMRATISGDEFMGGDDVLFGGLCTHTPCKVMQFDEFIGAPRQAEVRLRWNDPSHQLALYKFSGDPDEIRLDQPATRYGGSSEIVAPISVSGYFDAIAVAFEGVAGGGPGPSDSQEFELKLQLLP